MSEAPVLEIPDFALIVLIGATGSGKSTFAARWFQPTEIVSSDHCRGLVADDETDQSATSDAFELVAAIAGKRLKNRRLAVIDATNVRADDRRPWVELARRWHALPVAVVLEPPLDVCIARNKLRADRRFGPNVPQRMMQEIRRSAAGLSREGFRQVWRLNSLEAIETAKIVRRPLWTDRRDEAGPFDIIGDVHGCADELRALLAELGYVVDADGVSSPQGRKLVFVGDLVDRGPKNPETLRLVMSAVARGFGFVVQGNHDERLSRWLQGRKTQLTHGLQETVDQLGREPPAFVAEVKAFMADLRSHYWLDGGRLAVAHGGLREDMIGRGSPAVRAFALYGDATGETDAEGHPVRRDWAGEYRGKAAVIYGHTPVAAPEWVNNTLCIDTGCVYGGRLTALRWPEKTLVGVPAARAYADPPRALAAPARAAQAEADDMLDYADVSGRRWIDTRLTPRIVVAAENATAALEAMTRFAIAPQWLVYLPPTMSPVETSAREDYLERPEEALAFYRSRGQAEIVLQQKHMGSRAVIALCRDAEAARARFGVVSGETGAIWTRTGRAFFQERERTEAALARLRAAADQAGLWARLATDWMLIDAEIMPWSAKASALIAQQYAPVADSSRAGLSRALAAAERAAARGAPVEGLRERLAARLAAAERYAGAWAPYVWPLRSLDDLRIAPFHILASEAAVHFDKDHPWHMGLCAALAEAGAPFVAATRWRRVELADAAQCGEAVAWWEALTAAGGEGFVAKPRNFIARGAKGLVQPAMKVRGRDYLRIIYGPEYDLPENLSRLRERGLGGKRALALREFALGHEALCRFVERAPLRKVHECVFAVLALESEPIDPRL